MKYVRLFTACFALYIIISISVSCGSHSSKQSTRQRATLSRIYTLHTAIDLYKMDCGEFPSQEQGLNALIFSLGVTNWHGPYIRGLQDVPTDAWGRQFNYHLSNGVPFVVSAGADGQFGTEDDIHRNASPRHEQLDVLAFNYKTRIRKTKA